MEREICCNSFVLRKLILRFQITKKLLALTRFLPVLWKTL